MRRRCGCDNDQRILHRSNGIGEELEVPRLDQIIHVAVHLVCSNGKIPRAGPARRTRHHLLRGRPQLRRDDRALTPPTDQGDTADLAGQLLADGPTDGPGSTENRHSGLRYVDSAFPAHASNSPQTRCGGERVAGGDRTRPRAEAQSITGDDRRIAAQPDDRRTARDREFDGAAHHAQRLLGRQVQQLFRGVGQPDQVAVCLGVPSPDDPATADDERRRVELGCRRSEPLEQILSLAMMEDVERRVEGGEELQIQGVRDEREPPIGATNGDIGDAARAERSERRWGTDGRTAQKVPEQSVHVPHRRVTQRTVECCNQPRALHRRHSQRRFDPNHPVTEQSRSHPDSLDVEQVRTDDRRQVVLLRNRTQ